MIAYRLWRIPKAKPLVALSPFSVNTEKGPPEAQRAITNLIGVSPRKRTAYQWDVEDAVLYKVGA